MKITYYDVPHYETICIFLVSYFHSPSSQYSVLHVNKKVQLDATVCRHLFTAKSLYMFRASQHPSSEALKIVTATSGIGHNTGTSTSFQRDQRPDQTTLEGSICISIMTYTRGNGYSF